MTRSSADAVVEGTCRATGKDGAVHQSSLRQRSEIDEPRTIGVAVQYIGTDLHRYARLADSAGPHNTHQSVLYLQSADLTDLSFTSDE